MNLDYNYALREVSKSLISPGESRALTEEVI